MRLPSTVSVAYQTDYRSLVISFQEKELVLEPNPIFPPLRLSNVCQLWHLKWQGSEGLVFRITLGPGTSQKQLWHLQVLSDGARVFQGSQSPWSEGRALPNHWCQHPKAASSWQIGCLLNLWKKISVNMQLLKNSIATSVLKRYRENASKTPLQ